MDISIWGILLVLGILVLAVVWKRRSEKEPDKEVNHEEQSEEYVEINYNEEFYRNIDGRKMVDIIKTYNSMDIAFVQSILYENGINSLAKNEQTNSLFPGVAISGYTDVKICIAEDDVESAKPILIEMLDAMKQEQNQSIGTSARGVVEFAVGGYVIPNQNNRMLPELLI